MLPHSWMSTLLMCTLTMITFITLWNMIMEFKILLKKDKPQELMPMEILMVW